MAEKLNQLKLIETNNLEKMVEKVCCNSSNKSCMYGECVHCKDNSVPISGTYSSTTKVSFTQWVTEDKEIDKKKEGQERSTVKVTIKKSVEGTQENLTELFHLPTTVQTASLQHQAAVCLLPRAEEEHVRGRGLDTY